MKRTRIASMAAGGLNWDSLPLKLFAGGNAKFWNPADIDFSRDREDWDRLTDDEHHYATRLCAEFIAGEESVTQDIQPFMAAMRAEGRLALTGYFAWHKICVERGILPGMQELVRRIGDDERRHMAWGTFTCRRHVAANDANWTVFETRMNELMPLALRFIEEGVA